MTSLSPDDESTPPESVDPALQRILEHRIPDGGALYDERHGLAHDADNDAALSYDLLLSLLRQHGQPVLAPAIERLARVGKLAADCLAYAVTRSMSVWYSHPLEIRPVHFIIRELARHLAATDFDGAFEQCVEALSDSSNEVEWEYWIAAASHLGAAEVTGEAPPATNRRRELTIALVDEYLHCFNDEVHREALLGIHRLRAPNALEAISEAIGNGSETVRWAAATILLSDPSVEVHQHRLELLGDMGCPEAVALRSAFLDDLPDEELERERLFEQYRSLDAMRRRDTVRFIRHFQLVGAAPLLFQAFLSEPEVSVRSRTLQALFELCPAETDDIIAMASDDPEPAIHARLMRELAERRPEAAVELARSAIESGNAPLLLEALRTLRHSSDPLLMSRAMEYTRHEYPRVRHAALRTVAALGDENAASALVESHFDADEDIREEAANELSQPSRQSKSRRIPGFRRLCDSRIASIHSTLAWGREVGRHLLGRPVDIARLLSGAGRTWFSRHDHTVHLEVTLEPIASGAEDGVDVVKGLILHELGHHLFDYGARGHSAMRGKARAEGVGRIFDILLDVRLERKLQSQNAEWGTCIDRMNAHLFARGEQTLPLKRYAELTLRELEDARGAIQAGELPGRLHATDGPESERLVTLNSRDILEIPGLMPPIGLFLACLYAGFAVERCPDPNVVEAMDLIPSNLKDLTHAEVLQVAHRLGELLGTDPDYRYQLRHLRIRLGSLLRGLSGLQCQLQRLDEAGASPQPDAARRGPRVTVVPRRRSTASSPASSPPVRTGPPSSKRGRAQSRAPAEQFGRHFNNEPGVQFDLLSHEERLPVDAKAHARVVAPIRRHVRLLRSYFERLGTRTDVEYAARKGRRLDLARVGPALITNRSDFLVSERIVAEPDAYLGILIDRSGSMSGSKIERARAFGALVAESAKGLRGIEGHVNAFDDETFILLGDLRRNAIARLEADNGNNDSGALTRAAQLALRSGKRHRLIIMISDGSPTECTFESLEHLVKRLTREHGILCAQVAVAPLDEIAFPHYVDLSRYDLQESVARFGRLLMRLTAGWR